jgi:hypothetical protein
VSIALLACACASSSSQRGPSGQPLAVPAGGATFYRFGADQVELVDAGAAAVEASAGAEAQPLAVPADAGRPAAVGVDRESAQAAVAYERKLAVVDLARGNVRWLEAAWGSAPQSVAVTGGLAATVSGDTVSIWSLRDGQCLQREELARWLESFALERLEYALPLSRTEFLLVGFRPMGLTSESQALVQKVDLGGISREAKQIALLPDLADVQACAYAGGALFVAGVREEDRRLPGQAPRPGDLAQTLTIYRIDPGDLSQKAVVRMERHELSTTVRELAVGERGLCVLLEEGDLLVFELGGTDVASQAVDHARVADGTSATWLEEDRLALIGPMGSQIVQARLSAKH